MTQFKDHFSSNSDNYKQFRPTYPDTLFSWLASQCKNTDYVWDCGTGSGQAAVEHSKHFTRVLASDASEAQIQQAEIRENITYKVSPAELLDAPDQSFDLITVAQAIHWFNLPAFFSTVERVLKPGGYLAVWGYQFVHTGTALDNIIQRFHSQIVGPYWPPERSLLNEGYTKIDFPYERLETPEFSMTAAWNLEHFTGYLSTWSAIKKYQEANNHNPLELIAEELEVHWGDRTKTKNIAWPLNVYLGQKPTPTT